MRQLHRNMNDSYRLKVKMQTVKSQVDREVSSTRLPVIHLMYLSRKKQQTKNKKNQQNQINPITSMNLSEKNAILFNLG